MITGSAGPHFAGSQSPYVGFGAPVISRKMRVRSKVRRFEEVVIFSQEVSIAYKFLHVIIERLMKVLVKTNILPFGCNCFCER